MGLDGFVDLLAGARFLGRDVGFCGGEQICALVNLLFRVPV